VVDDDFKGFSIILHENKERRITNELKSLKLDNEVYSSDVQRSIRRQYNKHQTFKFLHNLEQTNKMDVRNSMIALFVPEADLAQLHRSRDNTIKRFDDEQASPRHSRRSALHAQQTFQLNKPPEFESFFQTYPEDDELDLFAFNVFDVPNAFKQFSTLPSLKNKG
jgi:cAMP-specific phosphodiesterase 4